MAVLVRAAALAILVVASAVFMPAVAQQGPAPYRIVPADGIVWGPAPPSIPAGAQSAVLYGDTAKDGLFAMRLKVPKGYRIAPHVHPAPEIVTVISGVVRLGLGTGDKAILSQPLGAGSFYSTEPGTPHFVIAETGAVIQVNSRGPWGIDYLNAGDDPRKRN